MWMHEVRLRDGSPVHAYKHIDTRGYVHLGSDGRGYAYVGDQRYRRVRARRALMLRVRRPAATSGSRA